MRPGIPWSVKGIDPEVRAAAKTAARRAGMTLGEWLNGVILDQNGNTVDSVLVRDGYPKVSFLSATPQDTDPPSIGGVLRDDPQRKPAAAARRDDSASRLQDIARQLADLAQKERQSAPVRPFEPERGRSAEDEQAFARLLERIDDNERQTVEALTAVNERLSIMGQQVAMQPRAEPFARPEDVPGYSALESAIRNVVEHIEISERRTRDSLKAMQDRLSELAEQAIGRPGEDQPRTAPVIAQLEARVAELSNRLQRTESSLQSALPEQLRGELGQIAERIESVKSSADQVVKQAQSAAAGVARSELREIETRVLASLREAQAAASATAAATPEIGQLKGEIGGLSRRMDEIRASSATERDLHALRIAVEHLSSRVSQAPEAYPLAEVDRRLDELGLRLDQVAAATGGTAHVMDIEARLAEIGQRVDQAMVLNGDPQAMALIEQNITALSERVGRTEDQLRHIETMEHAIQRLYDSLEQSREITSQTAEETASRTVERMLASGMPSGRSPELMALEEGLRAARESAAGAELRNQETLAAVHETLSQIVEKIAELERGSPRPVPAPAPAPTYAPEPQPSLQQTARAYMPEPAAAAAAPEAEPLSTGDDFIAAARRAAQAAASRPSALRAEFGPAVPPQKPQGRKSVLGRLYDRDPVDSPPAGIDPLRPVAKDPGKTARRRRLLLAGVLLLAVVSAFAYNALVRRSAPPPSPPAAIEQPSQPGATSQRQGRVDLQADSIRTASLSKADVANRAVLPPPETGTAALRSAAVKGDAAAQFIVASRYLDGIGTAADPAKAVFWYGQAAAAGLAPAQYRLATLLQLGKGVAQNYALALSWYERAARQGNVKSMYNAAVISLGGEAGTVDHAKAFALFSDAASRGLRDSQFNLAILYESGKGVRQDQSEAVFWYRLAALQGDSDAAARAVTLAKGLGREALLRIDQRLAAWTPEPSEDDANAVAVLDPAWQDPESTVLLSGVAEPDLPSPPGAGLVAEAQQLLLELGFNVGAPDGKLGSRTVAAIRQFQELSGLEVTGAITPEVIAEMRDRAG
ncbi:peptidoglycan-binding protein [Aestuariivirga sp.]|uniref:peptidoglycan-binding protein n=1 Tax=Aestuariivirga sp. TaxID=2650926 RepID=UPI003782F7B6